MLEVSREVSEAWVRGALDTREAEWAHAPGAHSGVTQVAALRSDRRASMGAGSQAGSS